MALTTLLQCKASELYCGRARIPRINVGRSADAFNEANELVTVEG